MRHVICTVDTLAPGSRKLVQIGSRSIGVFNIEGNFYALRNNCPHQGGPLCTGRLTGFVTSQVPGEFAYLRPGEILRCPWHGWEFDVKTGQSWFDPTRTSVATYPTRTQSGASLAGINTRKSSQDPTPKDLCKGPHTVETYSIVVEKEYVIVEIPNSS